MPSVPPLQLLLVLVATALAALVGATTGEEGGLKLGNPDVDIFSWSDGTMTPDGLSRALQSSFSDLNNYLNNVRFGRDPGPCPSSSRKCFQSFASLPNYIKKSPTTINGKTRPLDGWIRNGNFYVWDLTCRDISVESIVLSRIGTWFGAGGTRRGQEGRITVDDLRMDCDGKSDFNNLDIEIHYEVCVWLPFAGRTCTSFYPRFRTVSGNSDVRIRQSGMGGNNNGMQLTGKFDVFQPSSSQPPNDMRFRSADGCRLQLSNGFDLPNLRINLITGFFSFLNGILSWIVTRLFRDTIREVLVGIFCGVFTSLAYNENGSRGFITQELVEVHADIMGWRAQGLRGRTQFEQDEATRPQTFPRAGPASAWMDFSDSDFFELFSTGLNDYLGVLSTTPGYTTKLVVNEIVDTYNGDSSGVLDIPDIQDTFQLSVVPEFNFGEDLTRNRLRLKGVRVGGLNTFTNWQVLDNGFGPAPFGDQYQRTLISDVAMTFLELKFTWELRMSPGRWMTAGGRTQTFDLVTDARFNGFQLSTATLTLIKLDLVLDQQVGQLLRESVQEEDFFDLFNCWLRGLDHLYVSGLQAQASSIQLQISEAFSFEQLVDNVVSFGNHLYGQTIQNDLDVIMENFMRLEINDYLTNSFFNGPPPSCPPYVPVTVPPSNPARWFNLKDNLGRQFFSEILNEVVGGNPSITRSSVDINALLNYTLDYIVYRNPGGINADPASLYQVRYNRPGEWQVVWGVDEFASLGDQGNFRLELPGPRATGLDAIWQMSFTDSTDNDYTLEFDFKWGNGPQIPLGGSTPVTAPYLAFELPIAITTDVGGTNWADEDFTFRLQLQLQFTGAAELRINKNEMFQTRVRDLQVLGCMLATLEEKDLRDFNIQLVDFTMGLVFVDDGQFSFSSLPLGVALEAWRLKLQDPGTQGTISHFLNFIIDRVQNETIAIANEDFDPPYTRTGCLTQESPLEGTLFSDPIPLPNFTYFAEVIREATTPQETPLGDGTPADYEDPAVWERPVVGGETAFDLTKENNAFVAALAAAITPQTAKDALFIISETQPDPENPSILDPLYRIIVLEADNSTSLRFDPNSFVNVDFTPDTEGLLPGFAYRVKQVELTNLNEFTSLDVLLPYVSEKDGFLSPARFTTLNTIEWFNKTMRLTIDFEVEVEEIVFTPATTPGTLLRDTISVAVNLTGLDVKALLAIAVDSKALGAARFGQIIEFNETRHAFEIRADAFNCTLRNLVYEDGVFFPMLQANLTSVEGPFIDVTDNIFGAEGKAVIEVLVQMFVDLFRTQVPDLTQGPLRKEANLFLGNTLRNATQAAENCSGVIYPSYNSTGGVRTFNFSRSEFGPDLQALIDVDLLNPNSALNINDLIDGLISGVDFFFDVPFNNTNVLYNGRDYGFGSLGFGGFRIERLGAGGPEDASVTSMTILDNTPFGVPEPFTTQSTFVTDGILEISARVFYSFDELFVGPDESAGTLGLGSGDDRRALQGTGYTVANDFRIGLRFTDMNIATNLTTRVDITRVLDLSAGDVLGLYATPSNAVCLFSIFEERGLQVEDFLLEANLVELTLRCEDVCSSPMFAEINNVGGAVTDTITSQQLTDAFNDFFGLITALAGQTKAQDFIDAVIFDARAECKGVDLGLEADTSEPLTDAASIMGYLGIGVFGGAMGGVFFLLPTHRRRRNQLMAVAFNRLNGKDGRIALKGEHLLLIERKLKSAFHHPALPRGARFGVPFLIVVAIALFLAANLGTIGATVDVTIAAAGDVTQPVAIIDFTLATSINDMWNSGSYLLALLIFVASAAWPHVKSLSLLFCWFAPPTVLSQKRRGTTLEVLDSLGKWSLIDAYVLVMLQVAFRFYLTSSYVPQLDFLFPDAFVVDVVVKPGPSIYLFVIATMLALMVNHWMIAKHRQMMASDEELEDRVNGVERPHLPNTKRAIMRHVFLVPDNRNLLYGFSSGAKLTAGALMGFSALFVAIGSFLPLITFTFGGLGGAILGFVREDLQTRTYSSVSIALAIRDGIPSSESATQAGVVFLQMVYLVFTLITPIFLLILLAVLWFRPLTAGDQKRLLFVTEIVAAWEALLVLLVAILVAAAEVGQLAQFIIQAATGDLCATIVKPLLLVGVSQEDAVCFDVSAVIEPSGYLLLIGSIFTVITAIVMFRFLKPAIHDRDLQRMGRLDKQGRCPKYADGFWPNEVLLRNSVQPVSRIRTGGPEAQVSPTFDEDDGFAEAESPPESRSAFNPAFRPDIDV